jgi:hypothetical protein
LSDNEPGYIVFPDFISINAFRFITKYLDFTYTLYDNTKFGTPDAYFTLSSYIEKVKRQGTFDAFSYLYGEKYKDNLWGNFCKYSSASQAIEEFYKTYISKDE